MSLFPSEPKKIRQRIRRYERALRKEKEETGFYSDGYGKRLLLGPLYLLIDDTDGAFQYYAWYEKTFPDDSDYPMNALCWTLTLYCTGNLEAAAQKLRRTMFANLYLLPYLFGLEQPELDIWHGSNWTEPEHLYEIPQEVFELWDEDALKWAKAIYSHPDTQKERDRYIEIHRQLKTEPRGPRRSQLVEEASLLTQRG